MLVALLAVLVWISHRANLKRLFAGEEDRASAKPGYEQPYGNCGQQAGLVKVLLRHGRAVSGSQAGMEPAAVTLTDADASPGCA